MMATSHLVNAAATTRPVTTYSGKLTVPEVLIDRAERFGDRVFVSEPDGRTVTYSEMLERAQRFAGSLLDLGIRRGDRVATMLEAGVDYLSVIYGLAWAGAVDVPIGTALKGELVQQIVRETRPAALVAESNLLSRFSATTVAAVPLIVERPSGSRSEVSAQLSLPDVFTGEPVARADVSEKDVAQVLYTSGTTGPSKGVVHSYRSALRNSITAAELMGLTSDDVAYSCFPLSHITARSFVAGSTLLTGGRVLLRPRFSARDFWSDVVTNGVTWFPSMGAVIQILLAAEPSELDTAHRVRVACVGALPEHLRERFVGRFGIKDVWDVYGLTEVGTVSGPAKGKPALAGATGPVIGPFVVEIHDDDDNPVPAGAAGEIVVRPTEPDAVFLGYWENPEATLEACRNLWFHTGDKGRFDKDGNLCFVDRLKDSIRRRGENISAFEVERAVTSLADVVECAAYGVDSEFTEQEVMVAVVTRTESTLDAHELLEHCIEHLPRFAVPRYVRFVGALPRNASERVQKGPLRDEGVTEDTLDRDLLGIHLPRT